MKIKLRELRVLRGAKFLLFAALIQAGSCITFGRYADAQAPDKQFTLQWTDNSGKPACPLPASAKTDGVTSGNVLSSASSSFGGGTATHLWIISSPFAADLGLWPITSFTQNTITTSHTFRASSGVAFSFVDASAPVTTCSLQEDRFEIERAATKAGPFLPSASVQAEATIYVDLPLPDATQFCYQVRAGLGGFLTAPSNIACGTTAASLVVTKAGQGTVTSSPAGINCGAQCVATFSADAQVTLDAAPAAGSSFAGWSGACAGTGRCALTMDAAKFATANFSDPPSPPTNLALTP